MGSASLHSQPAFPAAAYVGPRPWDTTRLQSLLHSITDRSKPELCYGWRKALCQKALKNWGEKRENCSFVQGVSERGISKGRFALNQQCFQTSWLISRDLHKAQEKGCCPEKLWGVSSLDISQSHLDVALGTLFWASLLEQRLDEMTSRGPFPLQPSCDSVKLVGLLSKQGFKIEPPVAELLCQ